MVIHWSLARTGALRGRASRHARAVGIWAYLSLQRITGRHHRARRTGIIPFDDRSHRRSIKMVERIRITSEALKECFDTLPPEVRTNGATESFALAAGVVRGFLGAKWLERHVMPSKRKPGFLTINETSTTALDLSAYRVMDLAELLYNLQHTPGFDECITRMRDGDIEGTHAELDLGRMLYLHKMPFRYVVPQGTKGRDYDVDILYPGGLAVCADAKCKIETTEFSVKTIRNALDTARGQLPDDKPGIVFIKLPPRWMEVPHFADECILIAHDFLRTTKRVVSVKYYVSPITFIDGWLKVQHAFREVSNPMTDFGDWVDWDIFQTFKMHPDWNGMPPWWQRILFYPDGKPR